MHSVSDSLLKVSFQTRALEWCVNGRCFYACPMAQILLEPPIVLTNSEYTKLATGLNHAATMLYTGVTAIAVSSSVTYYVRIPCPFPRNERK